MIGFSDGLSTNANLSTDDNSLFSVICEIQTFPSGINRNLEKSK